MTMVNAENRTFSRPTFVKGRRAGRPICIPRRLDPKAAFAAVSGVDPVGIGPASIDPVTRSTRGSRSEPTAWSR